MAQQYAGPADFLPPVRRENTVRDEATITPTMPMTMAVIPLRPAEMPNTQGVGGSSSPVKDSVYLPDRREPGRASRFLTSCVAVAGRACRLAVRFRVELTPAALTSTLTGLGWWQHLAGAGGEAVFGYSALGVLAATVAGVGLRTKHERVLAAGAGAAVAFGDVAASVAGGPSAMSLIVAAVSTGLAYSAYVPWLVKHRKDHKQIPAAPAAAAVNTAQAQAIAAPDDADQDGPAEALDVTTTPFYADVIPYQDDDSDDVRDPIGFGWDENGVRVLLKLLYRHTIISGATDWGKSGVANLIIKKLLRKKHVEIYGIDLKPGAPELGPWAPVLKKLARTPEEARELLKELLAKGEQRGQELEEMSLASLANGGPAIRKWIPGDPNDPDPKKRGHGTAIFLISDEYGELIRQDVELRKREAEERRIDPENAPLPEPPITMLYESFLAMVRFLAMQAVTLTQQPSARVFGGNTDARGNYVNRISTRVSDQDHAQFMFGRSWKSLGFNPSLLNRPGEVFIGCPELPEENPPRIRVEYVSDLDIAADVAHLHAGRSAAPIGRFAPQGNRPLHLVPKPAKPAGPPAPAYPDGTTVPRAEWPDLYRVFCDLCAEHGSATKEQLTDAGPFASRDTVRRALDVWAQHGVLVRKAGRAEQFYLPNPDDDTE